MAHAITYRSRILVEEADAIRLADDAILTFDHNGDQIRVRLAPGGIEVNATCKGLMKRITIQPIAGNQLVIRLEPFPRGYIPQTREGARRMIHPIAYYEDAIRTYHALAWSDAMIARKLGVGVSTIATHRNRLGLLPADKFRRTFCEKYGPDALTTFDAYVHDGSTLQEIANAFGFTREYARHVFQKRYGMPWKAYHRLTHSPGDPHAPTIPGDPRP